MKRWRGCVNWREENRMDDIMRNGRVTLYTWHDAEQILYTYRNEWPKDWMDIDFFGVELCIYVDNVDEAAKNNTNQFLKNIFKHYFIDGQIRIPVTETVINIELYESDGSIGTEPRYPFPLFKDFLYVPEETNTYLENLEGAPVLAFHSYKGGVGRTLSLITFVRDMIDVYGSDKKVLIIDGDMEAPGLTWLGQQQNGSYDISYIDLLNIIGAKGADEKIFSQISHIVENSFITLHNAKMSVSQYFLPTYRIMDQLLDVYSNPERIMSGDKNKYIISDALSLLGQMLKVDMVLVDLRAGVSEYSAPLLFDPRVKKIVVTSTSDQSAIGTNLLIQQLRKQKNNCIQNILLTMVQKDVLSNSDRDRLYRLLISYGKEDEEGVDTDISKLDSIIEIPKSDAVIHLGTIEQICDSLNGANIVTGPMIGVVKDLFESESGNNIYTKDIVTKFRENLYRITDENITAEGSFSASLLTTKPVLQLGGFTHDIPRVNILGAKGSGKTYLYKQLLIAKEWDEFLKIVNKVSYINQETLICPVLCTEDRKNFQKILQECKNNCLEKLPMMIRSADSLSQSEKAVRKAISQNLSENDWQEFWDRLIWNMFEGIDSWEKLNLYLREINRRIIFLFDGLETLFSDFVQSSSEKKAIKALCKGFINQLYECQADHVGAVIFIRKDIAEIAVDVNFEQFRNQYHQYELDWQQKDALQLEWKLTNSAALKSGLNLAEDRVPIYSLSQDVIEENLNKVWGKKMGADGSKTAGTVRWVLASLSDFKGQLQARDIVRFFKFASSEKDDSKAQYFDRLLSPEVMKKAVKSCSEEKLKEVETEIHQLKQSFQILREVPSIQKQVPLLEEVLDRLTNEDRKTLERYGYLTEAEGEYYIPESIRYALGYNKTRRGGIKLVSLLVKQ